MASRRTTLISSAAALALAGGYGFYLVTAQTAPPELAQAPMNITRTITPAFVMAVDDSGSMTFQHQFAAQDGYACWSTSEDSFFTSPGVMRTSGGDTCSYSYSYAGPRIGDTYRGIPPIDVFGFSRSSSFNPAYFNPTIAYEPWKNSDGTYYPAASTGATLVDPRGTATINLASWVQETDGRSRFHTRQDMVFPAGTVYRLDGGNGDTCRGLSNPILGGWSTVGTGGVRVTGSCSVYIRYWPATFFLRYASGTDPYPQLAGTANAYASVPRVRVRDACGTGCDMWKYTIQPTDTVALQNFANWFSYYGNRNRAIIAGMTNAFAPVNNMRVGYFTINDHADWDDPVGTAGERVWMRDMAVAADRTALYSNMIALSASGGTPNRQAVRALGRQFQRTDSDRGGAPIKLACQKNAGMLFTDGYSNGGGPAISNANGDGGMGAPFSDGHADTLADFAAYYYKTNLRTDLTAGQVIVPDSCPKPSGNATDLSIDCNRNPHMNFYGITLGARGNLFNPDVPKNAYTDSTVYNNWPQREDDRLSAVDDIWHGTVNGRGEYINARSPADVTEAMRRIIQGVSNGASPSGTIAVTGARIGAGSLSIQPNYESKSGGMDWVGELKAEAVSANPITGVASFVEAWRASVKLAAQGAGGRTIRFGRTSTSVVPAVSDFAAGNVSAADLCRPTSIDPFSRCAPAQLTALATDNEAVAYLRGDRSREGALRTRTAILGDIINSPPTVSGPLDDYGYKALSGTLGTSYATFLTNKKTLNRPLVLVGANDGMFHIFDGRAAAPGGDEVFAYIPATALGHMGNLLFPYVAADRNDQKFQHRYYVDGPITVSDVNIGGVWKTIAVGTTGAGGRSVFALDITNPAAITVLWEVNNLITGNAGISNNIGHVLGKPVIVPVKANAAAAPSWKVIFGNGYNSTNQQARLFVVDAATGSVQTIAATEATPPAYNGLGNIVVVDRKRFDTTSGNVLTGRDRFSDTVYAADQHGAVWKFDLLGTPSLALSSPLFVARDAGGNRQSITGGLTAAAGPAGGVMLYFGTGSFVFNGDPDTTAVQTIYGILDRNVSLTGRGQLLQQTVGADLASYRSTSANAMVAGNQGWYLDLPAGERFVGNPRIESGIVFFPAYEPSGTGSADCSVNGNNWLYGLNALSGGAALSYVRFGSPTGSKANDGTGAVALTTGGSAPVKDVAVMTPPRVTPLGAGATAAEIAAANNATCSMVVRVAGAPEMYLPRPCGRQSWRQVR